jgi:hypothetical protein
LSTTTFELRNIISSLKSKDSYSYGGISTQLLQTAADFIVISLSKLFNQAMIEETSPD